ncbi:MAG TPA: 30S ribosome-binding factor RbfA [Gammaproteobacteria bacterium]|nr:30S ribosome-binding factor RbfA [Gammaproteobacteria bacterium]
MPREFNRMLRVGEQIRRELSVLIQQEIKDPRVGMVSISDVEVTVDMAHAKVFVTVLDETGDPAETVRILNKAARFLRHELARRVVLRTTPSLHFHYDHSVQRGAELSELIEKAVTEDRTHKD